MEGLRGLAVILVFFVHYATITAPFIAQSFSQGIATGLHDVGNSGVDLFFVLSGYLIYGTLIRKPQPFVKFMLRRIQRLYPTFGIVLAIYVALSLALPSESKIPHDIEGAVLYFLSNILLLPGIFDIRPIITVAWSLSYEMFFYLSVPLFIGLLNLRSWTPKARTAFFLALVVAGQALSLPHTRMLMFACGMVLYEVLPFVISRLRRHSWLDYAAMAAMSVLVAVLLRDDAPTAVTLTAMFCAMLLLCLAAFSHNGPVSRALVFAPLRWLGNISYSYYLMHGLVLKAVFFLLAHIHAPRGSDGWMFWLLLPPVFAATLAGSLLLFLLVERPFSILPAMKVRRDGVRTPAVGSPVPAAAD